jgi:hypothetical protein
LIISKHLIQKNKIKLLAFIRLKTKNIALVSALATLFKEGLLS